MDFLKSLEQSLLKFKDLEEISWQLTALTINGFNKVLITEKI